MSTSAPAYHHIYVSPTPPRDDELKQERRRVASSIREIVALRDRLVFRRKIPAHEDTTLQSFQEYVIKNPLTPPSPPDGLGDESPYRYRCDLSGIFKVLDTSGTHAPGLDPPCSLAEFNTNLSALWKCTTSKEARTFAFRRLRILDLNFEFHHLMNESLELDSSNNDSQDFYQTAKVDNHIHTASAATRIELLSFIRQKVKDEPDVVVMVQDGKEVSVAKMMKDAGVEDIENMTTESLDVAANNSMFHRFDNFNDSYNPFGVKDLRSVFMKTKNQMNGRYFAELVRDVVFRRVQSQGNRVAIEPRLSIYGKSANEWGELADWVIENKVLDIDHTTGELTGHVKWFIQIPRLCKIFMGKCYANFRELMENIFGPIFEATLYPTKHPNLHLFLCHVGAFDCVDDESNLDPLLMRQRADMPAEEYTWKEDPPYSYWCYHIYANLYALNRLREARGMNTFSFKPHCGEAGPRHHLATAYLLADSINHGWRLDHEPLLQYIYYLSQVGLGLCPLSNDALFVTLKQSPIGKLHRRGLRVALGTDDPLQFHQTASPLIEEYTVAGVAFDLNVVDKSEIARNSVLISTFPHGLKEKWLGPSYFASSQLDANNPDRSNVPSIRASFRHENLMRELAYVVTNSENHESEAGGAKDLDDVRFVHIAGHSVALTDESVMQTTMDRFSKLLLQDNISKEVATAGALRQLSHMFRAASTMQSSPSSSGSGKGRNSLRQATRRTLRNMTTHGFATQ